MIAVTAPASLVGSQILDRLLGHAELRVIARHPEHLPLSIHDGAEVVPGSHGDRRHPQGNRAGIWRRLSGGRS